MAFARLFPGIGPDWPWLVFVVVVMLVCAKPAWDWFQRRRAEKWPCAVGRIESVDATEPQLFGLSRPSRRPSHIAEIAYSYSVEGHIYGGRDMRDFPTEEEAWAFLRDLQGKPVTVHYNPANHGASALVQTSLDVLLELRPPAPASFASSLPVKTVPEWVKPLLLPFTALAALGLVASLWVHLGAVMGQRVAPEGFFYGLHVGIFVVWLPTICVAQQRVGYLRGKDFWKLALKGTPDWMRYMVFGFFGYAVVNFLYFLTQAPSGRGHSGSPPAVVWRGFSGHWMAFYSAAFATLYAALAGREEQ